MTFDELMSENEQLRLEVAKLHMDVLHKNAAIDAHKTMTLKATQRALGSECEVEALRMEVEQITKNRDEWQARWCRAQEQVQRWFGVRRLASQQSVAGKGE